MAKKYFTALAAAMAIPFSLSAFYLDFGPFEMITDSHGNASYYNTQGQPADLSGPVCYAIRQQRLLRIIAERPPADKNDTPDFYQITFEPYAVGLNDNNELMIRGFAVGVQQINEKPTPKDVSIQGQVIERNGQKTIIIKDYQEKTPEGYDPEKDRKYFKDYFGIPHAEDNWDQFRLKNIRRIEVLDNMPFNPRKDYKPEIYNDFAELICRVRVATPPPPSEEAPNPQE